MSAAAALTLAAFVALAERCAPGVPAARLAAYAQVESGFRPIALNVNGDGGGSRLLPTAAEAAEAAARFIAAGRSVDLGLMQVNNQHLRRFGLTVAEALDPCRNIAVGAAILADAERAAACIYNSGKPDCRRPSGTNGYPEKIRAAAERLSAPLANFASPVPASAAPPVAWDVWAGPQPSSAPLPAPRNPPAAEPVAPPAGGNQSRLIVELR